MEFKAKEIAEILNGVVDGNPEATVSTFARIESGKPGAIFPHRERKARCNLLFC